MLMMLSIQVDSKVIVDPALDREMELREIQDVCSDGLIESLPIVEGQE